MRKRSHTFLFLFIISVIVITFVILKQLPRQSPYYVHVDDFGANGNDLKDDAKAIQKAINYSQSKKIGKVKLTGNKHYVIHSPIVVKEGVELEFDLNTRLFIAGDFRALEIEKNASITNGMIEVTEEDFNSEVIVLNGKHQFWSHERTEINNVTIINSSGNRQGTGLMLFANEPDHFISFVNFLNLTIVGFDHGIHLQAKRTEANEKFNWVNGNRFVNITIDDCIHCILIESSVSIPNECTGNDFRSLQIQVTNKTEKVLQVSGSENNFEGVIWDIHLLKNPFGMIELTHQSAKNKLSTNIEKKYITDDGYLNNY